MQRNSHVVSRTIVYVILTIGAATMLLPFFWMIMTSFKTYAESVQIPPVWIPHHFEWDWYHQALTEVDFLRYYWNTIIMTVGRTAGQLLTCAMAAYGFARLRFPGRNVIFLMVLAILMVPYQVVLIPQYIELRNFNWLDTFWALIVPGVFSAYGTFLLRQFFMGLPRDLEEAARIDGLSYWGVFWRIALPLTKPALTTLAFFDILWSWNDFLYPLVVTSSDSMRVLSVGIANLEGIYTTQFPLLMAGAVMATVPLLILFIFLQRFVVQGIAFTGIKG